MSANSAFFFYLLHQCAAPCTTLHHHHPPIHFHRAAAVGYDGGTLLVLPKTKPREVCKPGASVQSPQPAVAKALGAILAPTLTPCTRCLYVQHLGPFTTSPPVAARLGIVGVGH